jgi:hypothetical protein
LTDNESFIVVFQLIQSTTGGIGGHILTEGPLVDGGRGSALILLEKTWGASREQ